MLNKLKLLLFTFLLVGCSHPSSIASPSSSSSNIEESEPDTSTEEPATSEEPVSPKIYEVSDLVTYFNTKGEEEGIAVSYVEEKDYWYLHYIIEESADTSKENLSSAISYFLKYLPLKGEVEGGYLTIYKSKYMDEADPYFVYVAVSSNHFAAISIYSYIEDNNLINDILIYDGRNGLYV
jgi:uncharacterized protein YcfL